MCKTTQPGDACHRPECRIGELEARIRELEARLARYEPVPGITAMFRGPKRSMSTEEIQRETERLLAICSIEGVQSVLEEVTSCPELHQSLTDACFRAGRHSEGQYLAYLQVPYD